MSYNPVVVIVVDAKDVETGAKKFGDIFDAAEKFGFQIYLVRIEAAVHEDTLNPEKIESKEQIRPKIFEQKIFVNLETILSSTKDETSRHFLRQCLKKKALLRSAELLGCSKIFLSECSNDLAVEIIAGITVSNVSFFQSVQLFIGFLSHSI